jgi:hypothetical protein
MMKTILSEKELDFNTLEKEIFRNRSATMTLKSLKGSTVWNVIIAMPSRKSPSFTSRRRFSVPFSKIWRKINRVYNLLSWRQGASNLGRILCKKVCGSCIWPFNRIINDGVDNLPGAKYNFAGGFLDTCLHFTWEFIGGIL